MARRLVAGDVVMYKPTRTIFAVSSGSWTGNPANKTRPCVVVHCPGDETSPIVAPLCGAHYTTFGWTRRNWMVADWWHPVWFANTNLPIPPDGAAVQRQPITLTHNPSVMRPSSLSVLKPSYIWAGDAGECIPKYVAQYLPSANGYLSIDTQQLAELTKWWNHCALLRIFY
ncbi:hypothetical protein EDD22DRAFT_781497 [Suillus occidentalis]|nr:hypothetical protein EDD22DRAFT_781497 [Suillus occidentalis]